MNMDAIHRSFLRAVVALCVAAMPAIRANAAMLTADNSSANIPVLSENFPIPMSFSDAINGTTLFTLISGPSQGTLAYYNTTSGIVSVTAGVPILPLPVRSQLVLHLHKPDSGIRQFHLAVQRWSVHFRLGHSQRYGHRQYGTGGHA